MNVDFRVFTVQLVSYHKNYNRNINFSIIGYIPMYSSHISLAHVVIYYSAYTHYLDALKVTQTV